MSGSGLSHGGDANVLLRAIANQTKRLRVAQKAHGDFHECVSDDLKQLALLFVMNGEHDKALPLLHQRLVIHEKFGPEDRVAETLQELGTVYRLHGTPDIALQHLLRALTQREKCHGKNSLKVAETLNSLALVSQMQSDTQQAEAYQLRSLQVLYESAEPEDIESDGFSWETYERLKQQQGPPSTAVSSATLPKGSMRKSAMGIVYKSSGLRVEYQAEYAHEREDLALDNDTRTGTLSGALSLSVRRSRTVNISRGTSNANYPDECPESRAVIIDETHDATSKITTSSVCIAPEQSPTNY